MLLYSLRLGVAMTALNFLASVVLIRGWGPIPAYGTLGAALGTVISSGVVGGYAMYLLVTKKLVVRLPETISFRPDWGIIRELFRFGLPTGFQGIAMNLGGAALLGFVGSLPHSAEAQAAYAVGYTQLFSLVTWTSVGLMAATSAVAGQNLGAGFPDRTKKAARTSAMFGLLLAASLGSLFLLIPEKLLGVFGLNEPIVLALGGELLSYLSVSALFVTVALNYTGALQGAGDTRSPSCPKIQTNSRSDPKWPRIAWVSLFLIGFQPRPASSGRPVMRKKRRSRSGVDCAV